MTENEFWRKCQRYSCPWRPCPCIFPLSGLPKCPDGKVARRQRPVTVSSAKLVLSRCHCFSTWKVQACCKHRDSSFSHWSFCSKSHQHKMRNTQRWSEESCFQLAGFEALLQQGNLVSRRQWTVFSITWHCITLLLQWLIHVPPRRLH
jgi:hypothetical protein